jgi:hypothetical protein
VELPPRALCTLDNDARGLSGNTVMFVSALMSYAKVPIVGRASRRFISKVTFKLILFPPMR